MKLLSKFNRVNLVTTIVVMLLAGLVYYKTISVILTNQVDKDLVVEEQEIFEYVHLNHKLPQVFESADQQITFTEVAHGSVSRQFINTFYRKKKDRNPGEENHDDHYHDGRHRHHGDEFESGRGLISAVTVGDKYYKILVVESKVETEDLIRIIFGITFGVILLLLAVLFVTNRLLVGRLWQPFYGILKELKVFSITDSKEIPEVNTDIAEFEELNAAVMTMSARVKNDYKDLKVFTENASHELLTPIAIINSKLDTLLQTENFNQQQSKLLSDLYNAVLRLNRLNQSMLLLAKIENRLLHDQQTFSLKMLTEEMISQFEEIFADKVLAVMVNLQEKQLHTNRNMVEILLNNLLSNAIRHNRHGGSIDIDLTQQVLVIKNTGDSEPLLSHEIFARFHKSAKSEGTGLGLTISKQICENFGATLSYAFERPWHVFTVKFE